MFGITGRAFPLGKLAQVRRRAFGDTVTEPQINTGGVFDTPENERCTPTPQRHLHHSQR